MSQKILQKTAPQDNSGLTGLLSEVATRLQNVEALRPVITSQRNAYMVTRGWDRLPPTSERLIFAVDVVDGLTIPLVPHTSIHHFLNERNATSLQADFH